MRVMREIPEEKMATFPLKLDLRKDIEDEIRNSGVKIKEIRMREIGFNKNLDRNIKLEIVKYRASDGDEYFLQLVNKDDILFGLLRLRIFEDDSFQPHSPLDYSREVARPPQSLSRFARIDNNASLKNKVKFVKNQIKASQSKNINKLAVVRELHIYGQALNLGAKDENASQHKGMGKWLMDEAEKIVKENKIKKLAVISGVGVRGYYRKLGYKLKGSYVVKNIKI
jgi:elongator complex protein 3